MQSSHQKYLLAVDPGSEKFGLAILDSQGEIVDKEVILRSEFSDTVSRMINRFNPSYMAVGAGTGSKWTFNVLNALGHARTMLIEELNTTLEARELAWKINPPGGIWRILPRLFWPTPPGLDAWAAVVIGRRALEDIRKKTS